MRERQRERERERESAIMEREAAYSSLVEVVGIVERLGGGSDNGFSKLTSTENKTT